MTWRVFDKRWILTASKMQVIQHAQTKDAYLKLKKIVRKRLISIETLGANEQRLKNKKIRKYPSAGLRARKDNHRISSQLLFLISNGERSLCEIMKPKNFLWLMIVLCHLFTACYGGRILVLLPLGSKSHKLAVMPVLEALAQRGHNLTIVSGFQSPEKMTNIHEIQITSIDVILEKVVNWYDTEKGDDETQLKTMITALPNTNTFIYDEMMRNPEFQSIMLERSVDLVIVDGIVSELTFPIIEHLRVPFVFHCSSFGPWTTAAIEAMGTDSDYASIPFPQTGLDDKMTFAQRLTNIRKAQSFHSLRQSHIFDTIDAYVKKDFPNARPSGDFMKEASLVLINSDITTDWPRSLPPTVIPIGAVHARPAQELPLVNKKRKICLSKRN
jgi:glucuronosyltransferase